MRLREEEVDLFAAVQLGTEMRLGKRATAPDEGDLLSPRPGTTRQRVLVCPPGTLGRLATHQGFVARVNESQNYEHPVSFVPWFEEEPKQVDTSYDPASVDRLKRLLAERGFFERMDNMTFRSAVHLCAEGTDREQAIDQARHFFRSHAVMVSDGLETLPTPWIQALPGILWATRRCGWSHLPYLVCRVQLTDGLLQLQFAQEAMPRAGEECPTIWDDIRFVVNASLYPNRWRPLKRQHTRTIQARWPTITPASNGEPRID